MIKYLGSKRLLLDAITGVVDGLDGVGSAVDLFSGSARVGHAFKRRGLRVLANDHNAYAATLARCYVQANRERVVPRLEGLLRELNALPGRAGFFTDAFCVRSRFFQPFNGERVDAIRERIAALALPPDEEAVLLVSLMEAADRVDSTTGVQMAYLKQWAARSFRPLELRMPDVLPAVAAGPCEAHALDALEAVGRLEGDLMYLDPPYNQHKYLGNYHIWETLVRWDAPELYGVACKRVDCRTRTSAFNARPRALEALRAVVEAARARWLLVSFSDEGHIPRQAMEAMLGARGPVTVQELPYRRYVGARIGIHNPAGERVGQVSHLHNREYLYLVRVETPASG